MPAPAFKGSIVYFGRTGAILLTPMMVCLPFALALGQALEPDVSTQIEEIVVTGTRINKGRTAPGATTPITILTIENMLTTGITEIGNLLPALAASHIASTSTVSGGTDFVGQSNLYELGTDHVLIFVNGKRRHSSALLHVNNSIGRGTAGVDLDAIPSSAVKQVEVLYGGQPTLGSDAIAGAVNFVLKDQPDTLEFRVFRRQTYAGDGDTLEASVNGGFKIGDDGFINLTAEYRDRGATNRSGLDPRQQFLEIAPGVPDPRENTIDRRNHRYGDPDLDSAFFFFNGNIPLSTRTEIYGFGGIARRVGESGDFYRRALDARTVPEIHPDGFLPLLTTNIDDDSIAGGIRTSIGEWAFDAGLVYGRNVFAFNIKDSNNVSLGPGSPTEAYGGELSFDQIILNLDLETYFGSNDSLVALGADWRHDRYEIESGEFTSYANGPDDDPATAFPDQFGGISVPGIQAFPGFRPANEVNEDRSSVGLYADIEMNLTDQFEFWASARFENRDDFGNTLDGKVAGRYDFNDQFALLGSVSTGFRAPSLHQQFFNGTSTQFITVNDVPYTPMEVGTFASDSDVVEMGFQAPDLDAETSFNLSFGLSWRPTDNFWLTADLYRINIKDRIVLSGMFLAESEDENGFPCVVGTGNCPIADILTPFPGVTAAQFFSNAIDTKTSGINLSASYYLELENGSLTFSGGALIADNKLDGDVRTPESFTNAVGAETTLYDRQQIIWLEDGQPKNKFTVAGTYANGPFSAVLRFNHFGQVKSTEDASNPAADQTFDDKWITDLNLSWKFDNGIQLTLGAHNLFDEVPDKNIDANSFNGIFPFNRVTAPFGFNGGEYYVSLRYSGGRTRGASQRVGTRCCINKQQQCQIERKKIGAECECEDIKTMGTVCK